MCHRMVLNIVNLSKSLVCYALFLYLCALIMKKQTSILVLAAGIMMLVACKEKKQTEDIITTHYVPQRLQAPIAMATDSQTVNTDWLERPYTVRIVRSPMDSVMVEDDNGQKYIDNHIRLTIIRQDGSAFIDKTFTRASFLSYVQEPFRHGGLLASLRYEETCGPVMKFTAVIGMPDAVDDLFVPLELSVDSQGGIGIRKNDDMGLLDYDIDDED